MLEKYQQERLQFIGEILPLFAPRFVLKGGTALSLFYGLNRYSEDLDFDVSNDNTNFINCLKSHRNFSKWNINVKKNTELVFRAMIDYGGTSALGSYPLKIEVSSRNKVLLQNGALRYVQKNGVNVYDIATLITMKIAAFSGRDKVRDLYDLGFLLKNFGEYFTQNALIEIHQKISYAGVEELNLLLADEVARYRLVPMDEFAAQNYTQNLLNRIEKMSGLLDSRGDFSGGSSGDSSDFVANFADNLAENFVAKL